MADYPFISIVVPVYNVSEYVDECLQSIASQDYQGRIECIIVDDCSQDDSVDHVHRFVDNYKGGISFALISHSSNKGLSAARNTGLKHISGEYLLFIDSDDRIPSDSISSLVTPLETESHDIVVGSFKSFGIREMSGPRIPGGALFRGDEVYQHYINGEWGLSCWGKLYRAELLLSNSLFFYEGVLFEDFLWGMEVILEATSLVVVDNVTYLYRIRSGSITTSNSRENKKEKLRSSVIVLSRIQRALFAHGLKGDASTSDYLEDCRIGMFSSARYDWPLFKKTYSELRCEMPVVWRERFHVNKWKIGRQIRDLHLAFDPSIGAILYFVWWHFCRLSRKFKRMLNKHLFR